MLQIYQIEKLVQKLEMLGQVWDTVPTVEILEDTAQGVKVSIRKTNPNEDCRWYLGGNSQIADAINTRNVEITLPARNANYPYGVLFTYSTTENNVKHYTTTPQENPPIIPYDQNTEVLIGTMTISKSGDAIVPPDPAANAIPTQAEIQLAIDSADVNTTENTKRTTCRSLWYFWNYAKTKITSLLLTGFTLPVNYTDISASDSILSAFGKVAKILSGVATQSFKGLMSAADKTKLDNMNPKWNNFFSSINATPSNTSTIDRLNSGIDFTTFLKIGYGLKYKISGTYYRALITNVTSSQITINGIPLTVSSNSIQEIYYGTENDVVEKSQININNSDWIAGTGNNILVDGYTAYPFFTPDAYLVRMRIWAKKADTGTKSAIKLMNGTNNITPSLTNGLIISADKTLYNSGVNISPDYYKYTGDTSLRVDSYSPGNKDTTDCVIYLDFVYE